MLVAAGVTFYAILALFPAMTAFVSIYGLFADPETVVGHVQAMEGVLPEAPSRSSADRWKLSRNNLRAASVSASPSVSSSPCGAPTTA